MNARSGGGRGLDGAPDLSAKLNQHFLAALWWLRTNENVHVIRLPLLEIVSVAGMGAGDGHFSC